MRPHREHASTNKDVDIFKKWGTDELSDHSLPPLNAMSRRRMQSNRSTDTATCNASAQKGILEQALQHREQMLQQGTQPHRRPYKANIMPHPQHDIREANMEVHRQESHQIQNNHHTTLTRRTTSGSTIRYAGKSRSQSTSTDEAIAVLHQASANTSLARQSAIWTLEPAPTRPSSGPWSRCAFSSGWAILQQMQQHEMQPQDTESDVNIIRVNFSVLRSSLAAPARVLDR